MTQESTGHCQLSVEDRAPIRREDHVDTHAPGRVNERHDGIRGGVHDQDDALPTHGVDIAQRLTGASLRAVY